MDKNYRIADDTDFILRGLEKMITDYSELDIIFDVGEDQVKLGDLLTHMKNNTEIGMRFKSYMVDLLLHYFMADDDQTKFHMVGFQCTYDGCGTVFTVQKSKSKYVLCPTCRDHEAKEIGEDSLILSKKE